MSLDRLLLRGVAIAMAVGLLCVGCVVWYFASRPAWLLTATNTAQGILLVLTTEDAAAPVYTITINNASLPEPIQRQKRSEITSPAVRTDFYDETLRPGRWRFIIEGVEIDVMPANLLINGQHAGRPGDAVVVETATGSIQQ